MSMLIQYHKKSSNYQRIEKEEKQKHKYAFYQFFELWSRHKATNKIADDEGEEVEKVGRHKPTNKLCLRTVQFRAPWMLRGAPRFDPFD
jgi:hypothetical protein